MKKISNNDFALTILTVSVPIIFQLVFIRYVSYEVEEEVYGNFVLLQTLIVALSFIFLQVPSQAYNRFYNTVEDKAAFLNEFRTLLIFINIISFVVIYIYGLFFERFSLEVLFLVFVYFLLLNNYAFNQQYFLLKLERKCYFVLKALEAASKFLMPILFYFYFQTLEAFLYGIILGYLVSFVFLNRFLAHVKFKFTLNFGNLKKYLVFAYPMLIVSIFGWGIAFTDRYFIDYFQGASEVAVYAVLAQVAAMGQVFGQIYSMYVNPKVLSIYEKNKNDALAYLKNSLIVLAGVFAFAMVVVMLTPTLIFELLIKPEVINSNLYYYTFLILVASIFMTILQTALTMYLILCKKLMVLGYICMIAFSINLYGNFYIEEFGVIAAAIATFIAYFIILALLLIMVKKYSHERAIE